MHMKESILTVQRMIIDLEIDAIKDAIQRCLDEDISPIEIIEEGISKGLEVVGEKFQAGEYYLSELVLSGEIVKDGMTLLEDKIDTSQTGNKGKIILATAKGDIHDIGKNIVGMLLSAGGYQIIDLGVDVHEDKIVAKVRETGAGGIALSVLLTTMIGSIKDLVDAITEAGMRERVKIAIGGACTSQKLADEMGVDAFGEDAVEAVKIFNRLITVA
jgi:methanogenic corrinoid protein MtbC1